MVINILITRVIMNLLSRKDNINYVVANHRNCNLIEQKFMFILMNKYCSCLSILTV